MSEETRTPHPPPVDRLSQLWRRVNEHKIAQWSVAYIAIAYAIQHGVVLTAEAFEWPEAVLRVSMLLLILGLPVVMTFAWYHGHCASRHFSAGELTIISLLLVIGSVVFYAAVRPHEEIAAGPAQPGVEAPRTAAAPPGGGISLAVLPFTNLSGDASQEFFSDGMTEEITSALAKVADLRVVARASAFQFKGERRDIRAVGQALSARYLIDGSVRQAGSRVRISAQLIEAANGLQVWTESYDRELTDIFATQEDIARAIVGALRVPLGLQQSQQLVSNRSINAESYQQYLRAKALVRARGLKPLTDAAALLEQVVARDPEFAPAWAELAAAYNLIPVTHPAELNGAMDEWRAVVDATLPKAEAAARRAIELNADNADAYVALGLAQVHRGKLLAAEDLYDKAFALDPNNPDALQQYSLLLGVVGRLKDALAMRQMLAGLEPFVPVYNANNAVVLWMNGQNDDAITMAKALPPGINLMTSLAQIYAATGRYSEAAALLAETPSDIAPGTTEQAARLLRTAPAPSAAPQSLPRLGMLGFAYLHVEAASRVLDYYEESADVGFFIAGLNLLLWHPSYAPVRKMERFKAFVRKAGLVEYWRAKGWPEFCHPTTSDDFVCN